MAKKPQAKKQQQFFREDCRKVKPLAYEIHPVAREVVDEMNSELGPDYPRYWLASIALVHLRKHITSAVVQRVRNGESLVKVLGLA